MAEVGEQLSWLGAAMRSSPYASGEVACCTPVITTALVTSSTTAAILSPRPNIATTHEDREQQQQEEEALQCTIGFKFERCPTSRTPKNGQCWHGMFGKPVIARGFPISRRPSNGATGAEMPLDVMAALVQARYINNFQSKVLIKGFSTLLVPTAKQDGVVFWHFLYNKDPNKRISYLDCRPIGHVNVKLAELEACRHVVGWCSEAVTCVGRASAEYDIRASGVPETSAKYGLEKIEISAGQIFHATGVFALGHRDSPVHISRSGYHNRLQWIASKQLVLWDEGDKRGWLVNGAGGLLHLLRSSLHHSKRVFGSALLLDPSNLPDPADYSRPDFALPFLAAPEIRNLKLFEDSTDVYDEVTVEPGGSGDNNTGQQSFQKMAHQTKYYCLKDRIDHIYNTLEKLIDYKTDLEKQDGFRFRRPRRYVEGWDFRDLVTDGDPFFLRTCTLQAMGNGWVDLIRGIHAVTLFGRGFGELITCVIFGHNFRLHWHWPDEGDPVQGDPPTLLEPIQVGAATIPPGNGGSASPIRSPSSAPPSSGRQLNSNGSFAGRASEIDPSSSMATSISAGMDGSLPDENASVVDLDELAGRGKKRKCLPSIVLSCAKRARFGRD